MFRRNQPPISWDDKYKRERAEWERRQQALLDAGPEQPCMSRWSYDGQGYCFTTCQTGLPAGEPHEHRSLTIGGFRERTPWGNGEGNPFERQDRERLNKAWVSEPQ